MNSVFGLHAVTALLSKHPKRVLQLFIQEDKESTFENITAIARTHSISIKWVKRIELDRLSNHGIHQGILAHCSPLKMLTEYELIEHLKTINEKPFLLILDGVQDPHNLGACLRTADAAGVHAVIAPKDRAVGLTSTVCKVASGAAETVPFIQVTNLASTMRFLRDNDIWLFGTAHDATQSFYQSDFTLPFALVLGGEEKGLRRLTREHCDALISIPMQGTVSSLNVSVATGVCLFEAVRQRQR